MRRCIVVEDNTNVLIKIRCWISSINYSQFYELVFNSCLSCVDPCGRTTNNQVSSNSQVSTGCNSTSAIGDCDSSSAIICVNSRCLNCWSCYWGSNCNSSRKTNSYSLVCCWSLNLVRCACNGQGLWGVDCTSARVTSSSELYINSSNLCVNIVFNSSWCWKGWIVVVRTNTFRLNNYCWSSKVSNFYIRERVTWSVSIKGLIG